MDFSNPGIVVALIGGIVAVIGTLAGLVGAMTKTGADRRTAQEIRLDARMDAALAAQDRRIAEQDARIAEQDKTIESLKQVLDRKLATFGRIIRQIRDQWTGDPHGPNIDPADIAELEDTEVLPREWIRRERKTL